MARKQKDVFGFDELQKSFEKLKEKYPDAVDAALMATGRAINRRTKQLSPVYKGAPKDGIKPGQLKKSWRLKKVKEYRNGTVRVVRIESRAPHAHLVEKGHKIIQGRRTRDSRGRYAKETARIGKTARYDKAQRHAMGIKNKGFVEGKEMLQTARNEFAKKFDSNNRKALEKLIKEFNQ